MYEIRYVFTPPTGAKHPAAVNVNIRLARFASSFSVRAHVLMRLPESRASQHQREPGKRSACTCVATLVPSSHFGIPQGAASISTGSGSATRPNKKFEPAGPQTRAAFYLSSSVPISRPHPCLFSPSLLHGCSDRVSGQQGTTTTQKGAGDVLAPLVMGNRRCTRRPR